MPACETKPIVPRWPEMGADQEGLGRSAPPKRPTVRNKANIVTMPTKRATFPRAIVRNKANWDNGKTRVSALWKRN